METKEGKIIEADFRVKDDYTNPFGRIDNAHKNRKVQSTGGTANGGCVLGCFTILAIPVALFLLFLRALGPGYGAGDGAIYLLVFLVICLIGSWISWGKKNAIRRKNNKVLQNAIRERGAK